MAKRQKYTFTSVGLDPGKNLFHLGALSLGAPSEDHGITVECSGLYGQDIDDRSDAFATVATNLVDDPALRRSAVFVCLWEDRLCTLLAHVSGHKWRLACIDRPVPEKSARKIIPRLIDDVAGERDDIRIGFFYEEKKREGHRKVLRCVRTTDEELTEMLAEELGMCVMREA